MGPHDEFADRVRRRLLAEHDEQAAAQAAVERAMRQRREQAERITALAVPLHRGMVSPRMETLARQVGAGIEHLALPSGLAAVVHRPRTPVFCARARLSVGVAWSEDAGRVWLAADQNFLPVLLPLDRTTQLQVDVATPDTLAIGAWVEERIMAFVDACLDVERSDVYRAAEHATDPVCGMVVSVGPRTPVIERAERRYYFCSTTCQERFAADPGRFTEARAGGSDPQQGGAR